LTLTSLMTLMTLMTSVTSAMPISLRLYYQQARKQTAKQASQNRRKIEKQREKKAKTKRVDTTQLQEYELPFRSS
jgi:hypothetical protein